MDHEDHDKVFFVNFGIVLAALGAIFFICIVAARMITPDKEAYPEALAQLEDRVAPVGNVVTDPSQLVKTSKAAPKREPYTGEEVLAKVCNACHQTGVLQAPKNGDAAAWKTRADAAGGVDGLVKSAIAGKNAMPARGGDPSLSDDEIRAAVELMMQ